MPSVKLYLLCTFLIRFLSLERYVGLVIWYLFLKKLILPLIVIFSFNGNIFLI